MTPDEEKRLLARLDSLERDRELWKAGIVPSGTLQIISTTGRAMILFCPNGPPELIPADVERPVTDISPPAYPRVAALAVGRAFQDVAPWAPLAEQLNFAMTLNGKDWFNSSMPYTELVVDGSRSGTSFTIKNAAGTVIPVSWMLLTWGGVPQTPGVDYTMGSDGTTFSTFGGIGVPGSGSELRIPLAWGKVTT